MKSEKLSPRQLSVAVLVGGLSTGAAVAGWTDWWWLLACAPAGVLVGWLLLRRVGRRKLHPILNILYGGWAVVLMAQALERTAGRLRSAEDGGSAAWLMVLLALPLLWMGWGKAAAFFRAVEIYWLAALVVTAAILLLGAPRVDGAWMLEPMGGWRESLPAGVLILSTGLFVLPYLYKIEPEPGGVHRGLAWLGALGLLSAALAALAAGLLGPVCARVDGPFFAAAGLLGDSARLEGLVSALWLLPDLTLMGLLSRTWEEGHWPVLAVLAALALALTGVLGVLPGWIWAAGCAALAVLTLLLPPGTDK